MFCSACGKDIPSESAYCLACGKPTLNSGTLVHRASGAPASSGRQGRLYRIVRFTLLSIVGVVIAGAIFIAVNVQQSDARYQRVLAARRAAAGASAVSLVRPEPVYISQSRPLVSGSVAVNPGTMWYTWFRVDTTTMRDVRVVGRFEAAGGSGNDIQAVLADADSFENWKDGHPAQVLFGTGKTTVASIDVPIVSSGTYYLGLNNRFALFSAKTVSGAIDLQYKVLQ